MAAAEGDRPLHVSVAYSPRAGEVDETELMLPSGSTVADALRESGLSNRHRGVELGTLPVGIWGVFCERDARLRDGDRVELYRPLLVDPKEARRQRQRKQSQGATKPGIGPNRTG